MLDRKLVALRTNTYKDLLRRRSEMIIKTGKNVTFDELIHHLLELKKL